MICSMNDLNETLLLKKKKQMPDLKNKWSRKNNQNGTWKEDLKKLEALRLNKGAEFLKYKKKFIELLLSFRVVC